MNEVVLKEIKTQQREEQRGQPAVRCKRDIS